MLFRNLCFMVSWYGIIRYCLIIFWIKVIYVTFGYTFLKYLSDFPIYSDFVVSRNLYFSIYFKFWNFKPFYWYFVVKITSALSSFIKLWFINVLKFLSRSLHFSVLYYGIIKHCVIIFLNKNLDFLSRL